MNFLILWMALAAAPAQVKLAAPGFSSVGVADKRADAYIEYLSDQLRTQGLAVVTASQISTLLGFERQKQLLGCGESSQSCLAELAGALGVDGVVTGSLNRTTRGAFVITLTVVGAVDGRTIASGSTRAGDEDALYDFLARFAQDNGGRIRTSLGGRGRSSPTPPAVAEPAPRQAPAQAAAPSAAPPSAAQSAPAAAVETVAEPSGAGVRPGWFLAGAGGAALIAGAVVYGVAVSKHAPIVAGTKTFSDRTALADELRTIDTMQTVSAALLGGGAALAAGGTIWALLPTPTVALRPGGATALLAWEVR